jgi:putative PEP-CTERM system TPR-repeat lipoprotein
MYDVTAAWRPIRSGMLMLALTAACMPALAGDPAKAAAFYEDGLSRYQRGEWGAAVVQLKNALQQDAKLLSAHVLLGRALLEQSEFPAAEAAFGQALKLGVSPVEIAVPRARLLMALGRGKQLLREISPAGLYGDDLVEVLTLRAKAHAMEGDDTEAMAGFQAAIDTDRGAVRPYVDLVPFLIQRGEVDAAEARVTTLLEFAGEDARAWNLRASLAHVRGRLREAMADYDKALSLDPTHIDARVARASLHVDLKQDGPALEDLAYLAEHARREPRSAYLRAVVAGRSGDPEAARAALTEVAALVDSLPPEYTNANEQLLMLGGLSHHGLDEREKAKEYLDILLRRYPRNVGARKLLAAIYLDENDNARALATVEPVLKQVPNDPQANLLAGRAQLGYKRYRQANDHLQRAVKYLDKGPDALFALGLSQLGLGEVDGGIANLEKAAALAPGDQGIGATLTTLYMQRGLADKALALARALVAQRPDSLPALNLLGSVQAARGDLDAARSTFEEALRRDPAFIPAILNLARTEAGAGQSEAASARLEALLAKHPDDARAMYEIGVIAQRQGKLDAAIDWLRKAAAKQPDQPAPALALVEALARAGQPAAALNAAKEAGLRHPEDLQVQAVMGQAYLSAGDPRAARQTFKNMTRVAEFDPDAQVRIGRLLLGAGYPDDAEYNIQKALTAREDYAPAHALAIDLALMRGQVDAARAAAGQLRKVAPAYPELARYEGTIALAAGDRAGALRRFGQLYRDRPDTRSALNLAAVQQQLGELAAAEQTLRKEQARAPSPALLDALGQLLERTGQWAAAGDAYRRLLADHPEDPAILRRQALVQLQLSDPAALATADTARALAPNDPLVIDTVGWIRLQSGDTDGALAMLRDARLRAPGNPAIRYHLAEALARSGRKGEAVAELNAALQGEAGFPERAAAQALKDALGR